MRAMPYSLIRSHGRCRGSAAQGEAWQQAQHCRPATQGRERLARHAQRADLHTATLKRVITMAQLDSSSELSSPQQLLSLTSQCWPSTHHTRTKLWGTHLRAAVSSASSSRCCAWYDSSDSPVAGMPLMHSVRPT